MKLTTLFLLSALSSIISSRSRVKDRSLGSAKQRAPSGNLTRVIIRAVMLKKDKLTLTVLCAGHFVSDSYSSVIYPLLPLIKDKLHLTSAQVFWLAPLLAISSSLMQPLYGFISDRYARQNACSPG